MVALFLLSRFIRNNSIVDVFWGLGFTLVALTSLIYYNELSWQKIIFNSMIALWGIRLALHIFIKNLGKPEDFRYAAWRKEWGKTEPVRAFFQVYLLQGSIMFAISAFIVFSNTANIKIDSGLIFIIGSIIFIVGFLTESIADYQKSVFKKTNPTALMREGLWAYSRHPNYFGEVVVWLGLFIASIPFGFWYLGLISFLITFYLLRFLSGVPMLEKSKEKNDEYQQYAKEVPVFFPSGIFKKLNSQ